MLEHMAETLANGERIEIRGFGSFSLRFRHAHMGMNPKSGEPVSLPDRYMLHFRSGKELRAMVDVKTGEWLSGFLLRHLLPPAPLLRNAFGASSGNGVSNLSHHT